VLKAAEIGTVGTVYYSFFLSLNLFYFNKAAISDPVWNILGPGPKWLKKAERYGAEMVGSETSEYKVKQPVNFTIEKVLG
jgi:hypothetical protein